MLWKGKLLQTALQNNSPLLPVPPLGTILSSKPPPRPCRAPTFPGQVGDMIRPLFRRHRGGSHPKRRCSFSHIPLPVIPLPQTPPMVEQAGCCHLSWPNPAGFGGSMVQSTPATQVGAPSASCSPGVCTPVQKWHQCPAPKGLWKDAGCSGPHWRHQGQGTSGPPSVPGPMILKDYHWNPPGSQTLEATPQML